MSVLKFELKDAHINLIKHLTWAEIKDGVISTEGKTPFGGFDHYDDMSTILYGKPEDHDPFGDEPHQWTDEQIAEMDKLLEELPTAIEVVLNAQTFDTGNYKTKYHIRDWKRISSKN